MTAPRLLPLSAQWCVPPAPAAPLVLLLLLLLPPLTPSEHPKMLAYATTALALLAASQGVEAGMHRCAPPSPLAGSLRSLLPHRLTSLPFDGAASPPHSSVLARSMKLHRLEPASSDLSAQTAHLFDKYASRLGSQVPFSSSSRGARRGGTYPPSRDDEFHTMLETEQFNEGLSKGGHGVPLTSCVASPTLGGRTATPPPRARSALTRHLSHRRLPQRSVLCAYSLAQGTSESTGH